jgi:hypothetical protein
MTNKIDPCLDELEATLAASASKERPLAEGGSNKPPSHYIAHSRRDSDLAVIHNDPRFEKILARYDK